MKKTPKKRRARRKNPPPIRTENISNTINKCLEDLGGRVSDRDKAFLKEVVFNKLKDYNTLGRSFEALSFAAVFLSSVCLIDTPPLRKSEVQRLTTYNLNHHCTVLRKAGLYPNVCKLTAETILYIKKEYAFKRTKKRGAQQYGTNYEVVFNKVLNHAIMISKDRDVLKSVMGRSPYTLASAFFFFSFKEVTGSLLVGWTTACISVFNVLSETTRRSMKDIALVRGVSLFPNNNNFLTSNNP